MSNELKQTIKISYDSTQAQKEIQSILKQIQNQNQLVLKATIDVTSLKTSMSGVLNNLALNYGVGERRKSTVSCLLY